MGAKISEVTLFIEKLLRKHGKPVSMKWIMERVCKKFLGRYSRHEDGLFHRKVWNCVHNGCVTPAHRPRFNKICKSGSFIFRINK